MLANKQIVNSENWSLNIYIGVCTSVYIDVIFTNTSIFKHACCCCMMLLIIFIIYYVLRRKEKKKMGMFL